jgi:hypothetical protein
MDNEILIMNSMLSRPHLMDLRKVVTAEVARAACQMVITISNAAACIVCFEESGCSVDGGGFFSDSQNDLINVSLAFAKSYSLSVHNLRLTRCWISEQVVFVGAIGAVRHGSSATDARGPLEFS